jgi:hypothetical protein
MARKNRSFEFELFDSPDGAYTVFENSLRSGMEYDANIEDQFDAVVLTRPTKVTYDPRYISFKTDENPGSEKFAFMVRVLGDKSPHKFLPDPCLLYELNTADAQRRAFNLIQQHTKVIMQADNDESLPGINSIVRVALERNRRGSFKTDVTKQFISIVNSDPKPPANGQTCQTLVDLLKYGDVTSLTPSPPAVAGAIRTATRAYGIGPLTATTKKKESDVPPFTKCAQDYYLDKPEVKSRWKNPPFADRKAAIARLVPSDPRLLSVLLTITKLEQPKGMPDFNLAGIQGDSGRWGEEVDKYVSYVSCKADGKHFRIFLGFETLEDGAAAFVVAIKEKIKKRALPPQAPDIATDAYNLMKWYYMKWNYSLKESEFAALEKDGYFMRAGKRYPSEGKKYPKATQRAFETYLTEYTPTSP